MDKRLILIATISGALAVGLGAFGAHALAPVLEANARVDTFKTAVNYHMFHTAFLLFLSISSIKNKRQIGYIVAFGILLFSGSLYILSVFDLPTLGIITPFGGVFFIISWIIAAISAVKKD